MSDALSATEALATVARATQAEASLRSRTEGVTWMVWGLVTAAIFLSFDAASPLYELPATPFWADFLWVPWVAAGSLVTAAVWRTAALGGGMRAEGPGAFLATGAWVVAGVVGFAVVFWVLDGVGNPDLDFLAGLGFAWLLMGAANPLRLTRGGRFVAMATGAVFVLASFAFVLLAPDASPGAAEAFRAGLAGVVPLGLGFAQAMRGGA